MKKRILISSIFLMIIVLYFSTKKIPKAEDYTENFDNNISEEYKSLIFDNVLRKSHGMTTVDSANFDTTYVLGVGDRKWIHFEKTSTSVNKNQIFKLVYNPTTNIVFDHYKIGVDSSLRIQSRIDNQRYVKELYAMLFIKDSPNLLSFEETLDIAINYGLINPNDTLFYGYRLYNDDDHFSPLKKKYQN